MIFAPTPLHQHDVRRFDVAVDDALFVRGREAARDLGGDLDGVVDRERPTLDPRLERLALVIPHGDEHLAIGGLVGVVNRADVGMVERRGRFGFEHEAFPSVLVAGQIGREELQGDKPIEVRVEGLVDDAHAAATQLFQDPVVGNSLAFHRTPLFLGTTGYEMLEFLRSNYSALRGPMSPSPRRTL